jgi:clan AA aspartic protease (TIGR02281 family)
MRSEISNHSSIKSSVDGLGHASRGSVNINLVVALLVAVLLAGFALGMGGGYYLWYASPQTIEKPLTEPVTIITSKNDKAGPAVPKLSAELAAARALELKIQSMVATGDFVGALDRLLQLELEANSASQVSRLNILLDKIVSQHVKELVERHRQAEIDALYQMLTLRMPERAEYYILLAEHRIELGASQAALPVLAQIENHDQLGERARQLIESITQPEISPPLASAPLTPARGQFIVKATLDGDSEVLLLIDTGASMTILDPQVLRRLGYSLQGRSANFSTANGVARAPIVEIDSLDIDGVGMSPVSVGALSIKGTHGRIDGLLGMDFLGQFEFVLDQDEKLLKLLSRRPD